MPRGLKEKLSHLIKIRDINSYISLVRKYEKKKINTGSIAIISQQFRLKKKHAVHYYYLFTMKNQFEIASALYPILLKEPILIEAFLEVLREMQRKNEVPQLPHSKIILSNPMELPSIKERGIV